LREADVFGPGDAVLLVFSQFPDEKVTADADEAGFVEDAAEF
jgi:hypothetical protein